MNIIIINGPNINLTGKREPHIYGDHTFEAFLETLRQSEKGMRIDYFQSNIEGELIDCIQQSDGKYNGIILNAGGYTHTSVAIGDAVAAIATDVVEVHMSNVFAREPFRHVSLIAGNCIGSISGFGFGSYLLAVEALKRRSEKYFLPRK